ncbi:MAG: co-chaperone DjlA [Steroidobacteraceae bacterium]
MNWGGKILGATVGAMAGGPVGAALGALIGHQFDAAAAAPLSDPKPDPAAVNRLFFPAIFRVMGHVARAGGAITESQIVAARMTMQALRLDAEQTRAAMEYFNAGKQPGYSLRGELQPLYAALMFHPELAQFFVEIQVQTALAGNALGGGARLRLQQAGELLGLTRADVDYLERAMRARAQAYGAHGGAGGGRNGGVRREDELAAAYEQLGVAVAASDEEVTKAYRRQMSKHHPDKLAASGLPEAMLEKAKERTQQIRAAYELIRERRGMA